MVWAISMKVGDLGPISFFFACRVHSTGSSPTKPPWGYTAWKNHGSGWRWFSIRSALQHFWADSCPPKRSPTEKPAIDQFGEAFFCNKISGESDVVCGSISLQAIATRRTFRTPGPAPFSRHVQATPKCCLFGQSLFFPKQCGHTEGFLR